MLLDLTENQTEDTAITNLSLLAQDCVNGDLRGLMELQVGALRGAMEHELFNVEYLVVRGAGLKSDHILSDATAAVSKSFGGAISSVEILSGTDLYKLVATLYGVEYFDVGVDEQIAKKLPFKIAEVSYADGFNLYLGDEERKKLEAQYAGTVSGRWRAEQVSLRSAVTVHQQTEAEDALSGAFESFDDELTQGIQKPNSL
jgi:hypothetical protein